MENRLTAEMKSEWLAALRSGRYKQCSGALSFGEAHCCLGVLNEVCNLGVNPVYGYLHKFNYVDEFEFEEFIVLSRDEQRMLSQMNDAGVPFDEIADHIEAFISTENF